MFNKMNDIFFTEETALRLGICRFLFFGWLFYMCATHYYFLAYAAAPPEFWIPQGFFQIFPIKFELPETWWLAIFRIWKVSLILSALGLFTRVSVFVASLVGTFLIGYSYCFGYVTHTYQPVVLVLWILMFARSGDQFSVDAVLRKKGFKNFIDTRKSAEYGWSIRYVQALFVLVFFSAGVSKILYGGIDWITSEHFKSVMLRSYLLYPDIHGQVSIFRINELIARHDWLCHFLAFATITIELLAPLAFFSKKLRPWIIVSLACMQTFIYLTVYVNFMLYFCLYLFWIPWDRIFTRSRLIRYLNSVITVAPVEKYK